MKNENEMNDTTLKGNELHGGFKTFKVGLTDLKSKGLNHQFSDWIEANVSPLFKEEWFSIELASKILTKEPTKLAIWATSHYWWLDYKDLDIVDDNLIGDEELIRRFERDILIEANDPNKSNKLFWGINKLMETNKPFFWNYHLKQHFAKAITEGRDIECLEDEAEEVICKQMVEELGTSNLNVASYMLRNDNRLSIENIVKAFDEAEIIKPPTVSQQLLQPFTRYSIPPVLADEIVMLCKNRNLNEVETTVFFRAFTLLFDGDCEGCFYEAFDESEADEWFEYDTLAAWLDLIQQVENWTTKGQMISDSTDLVISRSYFDI